MTVLKVCFLFGNKAMRVSFSSAEVARAAVGVLGAYGYPARQVGADVLTDCPALLAISAMANRLGLSEVDRIDLSGRGISREPEVAEYRARQVLPQAALPG